VIISPHIVRSPAIVVTHGSKRSKQIRICINAALANEAKIKDFAYASIDVTGTRVTIFFHESRILGLTGRPGFSLGPDGRFATLARAIYLSKTIVGGKLPQGRYAASTVKPGDRIVFDTSKPELP
jgi:hypothetical protein